MFLKNRNIISKIRRSKVTDYAALKDKNCLARMEANLRNASSHRTNLSKLTHHDETKTRTRNSQIEFEDELWWAETKTGTNTPMKVLVLSWSVVTLSISLCMTSKPFTYRLMIILHC